MLKTQEIQENSRLPEDAMLHLFSFLTKNDIANINLACKSWYVLANQSSIIKSLLLKHINFFNSKFNLELDEKSLKTNEIVTLINIANKLSKKTKSAPVHKVVLSIQKQLSLNQNWDTVKHTCTEIKSCWYLFLFCLACIPVSVLFMHAKGKQFNFSAIPITSMLFLVFPAIGFVSIFTLRFCLHLYNNFKKSNVYFNQHLMESLQEVNLIHLERGNFSMPSEIKTISWEPNYFKKLSPQIADKEQQENAQHRKTL